MSDIQLLGTSACHLCEQAETLLKQVSQAQPIHWQLVDVAYDDDLLNRYGTRIPVLLSSTAQPLFWPFSLVDLIRWLEQAEKSA